MNSYANHQCTSIKEFKEDLKRFSHLQKLLNRYSRDGDLKERLILNHIIVIYNLFGNAATNMLFFKISEQNWSALMTFLVYLNRIPEDKLSYIALDQTVINILRKL